ncbi:MAG TPA: type II toxin-antitoxin system prevent-host-death family antitoxin [Gammaproteobacteria bacterium]|nr:type II toxin-antitoxin system prevent-host-death family antitoxin [Gammaproteobacteria bacterium]
MDSSMHSMPAGEFKAKCLGVMEDVHESGQPIIVTKRGVPVVMIIPYTEDEAPAKQLFGLLKGSATIQGNIIDAINENWDAM